MKRLIWLAPFLLLAVWITVEGCRTVATPTFPVLPTATFTMTVAGPTSTPTKSPTATFSNTPGGPTSTPTDTPAAPTSTATLCTAASLQTTYTFASSIDCWHADAGTTIVQSVALSTAQVYPGSTNSLDVYVNNTSAVTQNAQVEVTFSSPQSMAAAVISMWVYVDATLPAPLYNSGVQVFAQNPWDATNYINCGGSTNTGAWFNASVTLNSGATTVTQLGLQLTGIRPGSLGNIYIDAVTITIPVGPTATPTSTPTPIQTWDFENGTAQGWVTAGGNVAGTVLTVIAPGDTTPLYALNLNTPFTAPNTTAGVTQAFSPLNLTGGGIRCEMWIDAGTVAGGYPGGQIIPSDGANTNYSFYSNLTQGGWVQLDLPFPSATYGSVNTGAITSIIVQASTGGTGTPTTGNVKIDDIQIY